jgi:hypothetical protein
MLNRIRGLPWAILVLPLAIGVFVPSGVIFALEAMLTEKTVGQVLSDIASRQFAEGENLFLLAVFGLVPFVVLSVALLFVHRSRHGRPRLRWMAIGGLVGILALMIPMHVLVWLPLYTNADMGSTAVLAFLFIPWLCCASLIIGLGTAELLFRRRYGVARSGAV